MRRLPKLWYTHTYICIKKCTNKSLHKNSFAKLFFFFSKPWNDWWLNMYTALHLTVKYQYGNEWNQMDKHLRDVTLKISRAPLLILAISLPPMPTTYQHETRQRRLETGGFDASSLSTLSVSFTTTPFISATGRARAAQLFFGIGGGGQGVCEWWCSTQIKFDKYNVALHLRESGGWRKKAAAPSQTLTALLRWNGRILKGQGRNSLLACN